MNITYVKQFDTNGLLLNPIEGIYINEEPNRKTRRQRPIRFTNNKKHYHLTVHDESRLACRFRRFVQIID